ncbi:hypothetical protein K2O51_31675 (plasmid) [Cupriavidus pinatubonensis]|uniref:DUF6988 family protein n=1 Tax=Cupriavidus pinatubonensis TaxID=248026 RepID=UPI001C73A890|nr:hypothetical protein [Cupriavidus pinatubonensis]QYY33588.1 hypothetical protein K2O51_31675 [Cupriavidus pinatubonensis]
MELDRLLERSMELQEALAEAMNGARPYDLRWSVAQRACAVAWDHASALQLSMSRDLLVPAIALLRLQYEAFARAAWVGYTASDRDLELISAPLSEETSEAAARIPTLSKMVEQLGRSDSPGAHSAHQMLLSFKGPNWAVLNSYVHAGIHPLTAAAGKFPEQLAAGILRMSNGLAIGNGMVAVVSSGEMSRINAVRLLQRQFLDCCPSVLHPTTGI